MIIMIEKILFIGILNMQVHLYMYKTKLHITGTSGTK